MGPTVAPSDDLRVKARPAWAKLPLHKNHNWLGSGAARTLYLGRLAGMQCWAAELPGGAEAPAGMAWAGPGPVFPGPDGRQFSPPRPARRPVPLGRPHPFVGSVG